VTSKSATTLRRPPSSQPIVTISSPSVTPLRSPERSSSLPTPLSHPTKRAAGTHLDYGLFTFGSTGTSYVAIPQAGGTPLLIGSPVGYTTSAAY
jgi:hypothetical protein